MQVFFDVLSPQSKLYDYQGRHFDKLEQVADMAELIAIDLENSDTDDWTGSQIQAKDIKGQTLFTIPVRKAA